jgi:threonine dehydratase
MVKNCAICSECHHLKQILLCGDTLCKGLENMATTMQLPEDRMPDHRLKLADIYRSRDVIDPVFLNSPQYDCEPLSKALGCTLTIKLDFTNPIRSFKGRGASFLVRSLVERDPSDHQLIVGASAGNWGQAMAYACRQAARPIVLYASVNANALKVERMRALGAEVRLHGVDFDASKKEAQAFAKEVGARMVGDGFDPEVSEGAGTIAIELLQQAAVYDAVLVPLGNGAMLNGVARWLKAAAPETRVIGVSATGADAMEKSWRTRTIILPPSIATIADGIGVRVPIPEAVNDMHGVVDDVHLVSDDQIIEAMRLIYRHAGLLIEPSGAAGVAAILADSVMFRSQRVATILCGSNVTEPQIRQWIVT